MAGPLILSAPTSAAGLQRQPARAPSPLSRQLIEARVSVEGRVFRTLIREGATVNELIEKVAKENGGWVKKKYYPELKTWEIIRVQIGDILLVKGKEEGIHFGLGTSGIPMASAGEQIVFPNAEELRVGKETSNIGLWMTSANFDPGRVADLNQIYSSTGGIRLSDDARKKLEESHGGVRSEKLLLHDNLLVLDKESGEIRTASEHAAKIAVEGFAAPQFQTPTYTSVGLTMATDRGVLAVPMDGSAVRVPYLFVKSFDGRITDHISVQFNPLRAEAPARPKEKEQPRSDAQPIHFQAICAQADDAAAAIATPAAAPQEIKEAAESWQRAIHAQLTPETIAYYWHNPRPAQQETPCAPRRKPAPAIARRRFAGALPLMRRILETADEARKEAVKSQARPEAVVRPGRRRRRRNPAAHPVHEARKKETTRKKEARKPVEIAAPAARRRNKRAARPAPPEAVRLKRQKRRRPGALILPKAQKPRAARPKARIAAPKPRTRAKSRAAAHELLKTKPRVPARDAKKNRAKKKLPAHFMMGLLGLLAKRKRRFSRGRASAGN